MATQTEAPVNQRRRNGRPARTQQSAATSLWTCLNSPLALWVLSSVILSSAVYAYQTWQDSKHQQEITGQKTERLTLEIAGRVSQFGTWTRDHLVYEQDGHYQFQDGTNKPVIEKAIADLARVPNSGENTDRLYVHEMFSEFRKRNLLSLYAELNAIARQKLEDLCHCDIDKDRANFDPLTNERGDIQNLYVKTVQYKEAEVALLSPDYLLRYASSPDHDTFIRSFEGVFLTDDIRRSGLPSTDCLENMPQGGICISYQERSQPEVSHSANPLMSANDREPN